MTVEVNFVGFDRFAKLIRGAEAVADQAADLAVSESGRFAFRESSKEIREQANFSASYIGGEAAGGNRLKIQRGTRGGRAIVRILGRDRPTSLARFVQGNPAKGAPVRVQVKPGRQRTLQRAFLVKLRRGKTLTEDNFNQGLAIRLPKGATLSQRRRLGVDGLPEIFPNVFLLYGPSVAQVFNTVSKDVTGRVGAKLESEFVRQFNRLLKAA
ncbi:MAG: hypothetical protein V4787_11650 [Pseudomonadota bacterium]